MKKFLNFLLVSCLSVSVLASDFSIDDVYDEMWLLARRVQVDEILRILNTWVAQYPQCYQDVADIKEAIDTLLDLTDSSGQQLSGFHDDFSSFILDLRPLLESYDSRLLQIVDANQYISYLTTIPANLDLLYNLLSLKFTELAQLISATQSKLPDFDNWSPDVKVSNFADLKEILRQLFDEIVVYAHCTLDSDSSFNVNAQFNFDYDFFSPIKLFHEKANRNYFSLNGYTRYHPRTWLYNESDSMDFLVTPVEASSVGTDFLDFLCGCGNALVAQNQDISMLLCQLLGFFKAGHEDQAELERRATSAADEASQNLDSLKSAFHASSLDEVASMYFVDLNIDEKFDTDFLNFAHGAGSTCPEYVFIGPIPFSKIYSSMTDYTFQLSTAGLSSFFDVCRQCFTVIWYLFFLTICIFLARFGWAFIKPVLRVVSNILNW